MMAASAARESKPKSGRVMPILSNTRVKIAETDTVRNEPRAGRFRISAVTNRKAGLNPAFS